LQYDQPWDHTIFVKGWGDKLHITLSKPITSATSPFAGNFHPKAYTQKHLETAQPGESARAITLAMDSYAWPPQAASRTEPEQSDTHRFVAIPLQLPSPNPAKNSMKCT
jgi:hypothetical protein